MALGRQLGDLKALRRRAWLRLGGLKRSLGRDSKGNPEGKKGPSKRWVGRHVTLQVLSWE